MDGPAPLDPHNEQAIAEVARLHADLLAGSMILLLGDTFTRRFYYQKLVEDGLINCDVYYDNGKAIGFLSYTAFASDFMSKGLRRHWLYLASILARSLVTEPQRLRVMLSVVSYMRMRTVDRALPEAELLSLAVSPREAALHARRTGKRVSVELFWSAQRYFHARGIRSFQAVVEASNRRVLQFYRELGCRIEELPGTSGKAMRVTSDVRLRKDADRSES